jgi:hypothetical protein
MVDIVIVSVRANTHVIARLKIANPCGRAGNAHVFSRLRDRDGVDRLVVGLNDDIILPNAPQHPGECRRGLIRLVIRRLTSRSALRIPAARISTTGIPNAGSDDLAKTGNSGQQEKGQ